MEVKEKSGGFRSFLKRYSYYLILISCVLALALVITFAALTNSAEDITPVNTSKIEFTAPVANSTLLKGYSNTELMYNSTLNQWEAHMGCKYGATIGTEVVAVYDGLVKSITNNSLEGTVITIDHGDGLLTTYGSLETNTLVNVGDNVTQGQHIANIGNTATREVLDSPYLNFQVIKNSVKVDPADYLSNSNK